MSRFLDNLTKVDFFKNVTIMIFIIMIIIQCTHGFQEEQELLRKRRAQMQRRGDSVERDERDFEQCPAIFRSSSCLRIGGGGGGALVSFDLLRRKN